MQEPDDVVHFPVAFGRIAMNAAVWGAVALGVLAVGVLSSTVFLMRSEIVGLGRQLQQKDVDLTILSGELQKVRDQMFGEAEHISEQGIGVRLVNAETGVASSLSGVRLRGTNYPLGPESRAVNGKYLYWTDAEGILRVNLEDGTAYRVVTKPFISSVAVSKDGSWLAYAYSQGLSDPRSVGSTQAVVMPLTGRGDPVELGVLAASEGIPKIYGFSDDGKELLWVTLMRDVYPDSGLKIPPDDTLNRTRIANGQAGPAFIIPGKDDFLNFSPDGSVALLGEVHGTATDNEVRYVLVDASGKRTIRYTVPHIGVGFYGWSVDGSEMILGMNGKLYALPLQGRSAPTEIVSFLSVDEPVISLVAPGKFVLQVVPGLAGRYMYWNLATEAIASGDGPFSSIMGWSSDLNAVVLLSDTRE